MNLSLPAEKYNQTEEAQRNKEILRADDENHKKFEDIDVGPDCRIIFTDTNGVRWAMTVSIAGAPVFVLA